ncbi:MAG: efflux RND transporter periplasmic adaptor subunit, partial [Myxococcaceae bacterium]|nr:efflux RND transporter periplasmic adaptor subunit [Myxococcaceae bacterium]
LPSPGRVDFDEKRTANVGSPLSGRVESVEVRLGDPVKQGDRLFSVRSGAFADLEREVDGAKADLVVKERVAQRTRELVSLRAAAEKELQAAEAEVAAASLAVKAAVAKRQSLKVGAGGNNLFWVTAPRAGAVVDVDVYAGQEVTPDRDKSLVRISDLDEVLVIADMPETDLGDLKLGDAVTVRALGRGLEKTSTVSFISEVVDPKRRTVEVRARLANEDRSFRPNAFVEVVPAADGKQLRVRVPDTAVVTDGSKSVVFVARSANRLEPVQVQTGRHRDGEVELVSGLEPGMRYVARGALLLLNQVDLGD